MTQTDAFDVRLFDMPTRGMGYDFTTLSVTPATVLESASLDVPMLQNRSLSIALSQP